LPASIYPDRAEPGSRLAVLSRLADVPVLIASPRSVFRNKAKRFTTFSMIFRGRPMICQIAGVSGKKRSLRPIERPGRDFLQKK
jgi:hypothetical protein